MTDPKTPITDEQVMRWMNEAGIANSFIPHPWVEMFRKVVEIALEDHRRNAANFGGGADALMVCPKCKVDRLKEACPLGPSGALECGFQIKADGRP